MRMEMLALAVLTLAGTAAADTRSVDRSEAFIENGYVEIYNTAGSIRVVAWDRAEIQLVGEIWTGVEEVVFEVRGRRAVIKIEVPRHTRYVEDSDITVYLPRASRIDVGGVSADVTVEGVTGDQDLSTVSGDIITALWGSSVDAGTVSGDVEVDGLDNEGELDLATVSGEVTLRNGRGRVDAGAVSGEIRVYGSEFESVDLGAVSGDIVFEGSLTPGADFEAGVVSGDINIYLTGDVDAAFEIETFSGDIENDFGPEPRRTSRYAPGMELSFEEGDGSATVSLSSLSGEIVLRRR
jgi:putative adhesin